MIVIKPKRFRKMNKVKRVPKAVTMFYLCFVFAQLSGSLATNPVVPAVPAVPVVPQEPKVYRDIKNEFTIKAKTLSERLLTELFNHRHQSTYREIAGWTEWPENLADFKKYYKKNPNKNDKDKLHTWTDNQWDEAWRDKKQTNEKKIAQFQSEKNFQTVAVAIDRIQKQVAVAANLYTMRYERPNDARLPNNFWSKNYIISDPVIQSSEHEIIKRLISEDQDLKDYGIVVITPKYANLQNIPVAAREYHAEMQIYFYYLFNRFPATKEIVIQASKPNCIKCFKELDNVYYKYPGEPYGNDNPANWKNPADHLSFGVVGEHIKESKDFVPNKKRLSTLPEHLDDEFSDKVKALKKYGGSCNRGSGRRRRSVCSNLKDFTEIDADEFEKIHHLPDDEKQKLIAALDETGVEKLKGNERSIRNIKHIVKGWKSNLVHNVNGMIKTGTLMAKMMFGKSDDLSALGKSLISPKLIAESIHKSRRTTLDLEDLDLPTTKKSNFDADDLEKQNNFGNENAGKKFRKFETSHKVVKAVNLAMIGKHFIGGVLEGDAESIAKMTGLLVGGKLLDRAAERISAKGFDMVAKGKNLVGNTLKATGPIVGSATLGLSAYSLVGQVNTLNNLTEDCEKNDKLFQEKFETDCAINTDVAIANVVGESVNIALGVASAIVATLTMLSVSTGPLGIIFAAVDISFAIGVQIFTAVKMVEKIGTSLEGGLVGDEAFETGIRAFFGMGPPPHLRKLLDTKASWNQAVGMAVEYLKRNPHFEMFIGPTTHSKEVNCKSEYKSEYGFFHEFATSGLSEFKYNIKLASIHDWSTQPILISTCDTIHEFDPDSEADFRYKRNIKEFRIKPNRPSKANLVCNPNQDLNKRLSSATESGSQAYSYLCWNTIAVQYHGRQGLPVIIDMKNGIDTVYGFPDKNNVFILGEGLKYYTGGQQQDTFVLNSAPFKGHLDGRGGNDVLHIPDDTHGYNTIEIDLNGSSFENIEQIEGRKDRPDNVVASCDTLFLNLKGGTAHFKDKITIPNRTNCHYNLAVTVHSNTHLNNEHSSVTSSFAYQVEMGRNISVKLQLTNNISHRFVFLSDISKTYIRYKRHIGYSFPKSEILIKDHYGNEFTTTYNPVAKNFTLVTDTGIFIEYDSELKEFYGVASISMNSKNKTVGLANYSNKFMMGGRTSDIELVGGDKDDIFMIQGINRGRLDGGLGKDLLAIDETISDDNLYVNFSSGQLKSNELLWQFSNVEHFLGRRRLSDNIIAACGLEWIDLGGGLKNKYDTITIPIGYCWQTHATTKMTILVRQFTIISNYAAKGEFVYHVDVNAEENYSSEISCGLTSSSKAVHQFLFSATINEITKIVFKQRTEEIQINFENNGVWKATINAKYSHLYTSDQVKIIVYPELYAIIRSSTFQRNLKQFQTTEPSNEHENQQDTETETKSYEITGLLNHPNLFLLDDFRNTSVKWKGGRKSDIFVISADFQGQIDGDEDVNTLILTDEFYSKNGLLLDFTNGQLSLNTNLRLNITFRNLQTFIGREIQSEAVIATCSNSVIDTNGRVGSNSILNDFIGVPLDINCDYNLKMSLRPNLVIENQAFRGKFYYEGDIQLGNTTLFLPLSESTNQLHHEIALQFGFNSVEELKTEDDRLLLKKNGAWFSTNYLIAEDSDYHSQPKIVFMDGLQLKISHYGELGFSVYGRWNSQTYESKKSKRSLLELSKIQLLDYQKAAKRLKTNLVLQTDEENFISVGAGGDFDVITAVPGFKNILVGNEANQTIFRIADETTEVTIQHVLVNGIESQILVLDLSPVIKNRPNVYPKIERTDSKLLFEFENCTVSINEPSNDLSTWKILLRDVYMSIKCVENNCTLVSGPIVIDLKEHEIVILSPLDMEPGSKILLKNGTDLTMEPIRLDNSLVLSNVFQDDDIGETISVTIMDFFERETAQVLETKNINIGFEGGNQLFNLSSSIEEEIPRFEDRAKMFQPSFLSQTWVLLVIASTIVTIAIITAIVIYCFCCVNRKIYITNSPDSGKKFTGHDKVTAEVQTDTQAIVQAKPYDKNGRKKAEHCWLEQKLQKYIVRYYNIPLHNLNTTVEN